MQISDVMTSRVLTVREEDSLERAIQLMLWSGIRHLPVVRDKQVVGVLTEGTILIHQAEPRSPASEILAGNVMTSPAEVTSPTEDVNAAAARMVATRIGCLLVVDQGALVGIVTRSDVLARSTGTMIPPGPGVIRVAQVMNANPVARARRTRRLLPARNETQTDPAAGVTKPKRKRKRTRRTEL